VKAGREHHGDSWGFKRLVPVVVVLLLMLSVPIQGLFEAIYWLKTGEAMSWSLSDALPGVPQYLASLEWVGLKRALLSGSELWVSAVPGALGLLLSFGMKDSS
jgi:hypothetical protein